MTLIILAHVGQHMWDGWAISSSRCLDHQYQVPSLDQGPHILRTAGMTESGSITGLCEEALWLQNGVHDTYNMEAPPCQLW